MLTIIILGFVLFIVGVGATIFHDAFKKAKARQEAQRQEFKAKKQAKVAQDMSTQDFWREEQRKAMENAAVIKARNQQRLQDMLSGKNTTTKSPSKRVVLPGAVKTGFHKPGDMPTDTQETMSLQDLIDHVESMKNKK